MKHIFTFIILALFVTPLGAQDLIVTGEGDSLNCKITKVKTDNIYFTFKYKDEIRNTLLPVSQVKDYKINYYATAEVPTEQIKYREIYPHFRFALNGGWSYRTAKIVDIQPDFKEYARDLKSGFHYNMDMFYYFTEMFGVGLKYNNALFSNEINNVQVTYDDGSTKYGKMSDNIQINFIGALFSGRFFNAKKKNCWLTDIGLGYLGYKDKITLVSDTQTLKGNTLGFYVSVGYDIGISKNFALGFQLSVVTGSLNQFKLTDGNRTETIKLEKDKYENLSRIDLSIGLRFNK
ncbi:MAG: autotransporter outer membrane beta-barrel domain-containing protein [Prevotellaceae bacterium]|jgi:hypothetical protein|nr:autotransporter outer membrane beta-barrel domain-containing protein [Prevotellaceae bacterium]